MLSIVLGAEHAQRKYRRAIKRGSGDSKDGIILEEVYYEGYGPHGVALMISCVTDNRNRAVSEVRHILNRQGGSLARSRCGCLAVQADFIFFFCPWE